MRHKIGLGAHMHCCMYKWRPWPPHISYMHIMAASCVSWKYLFYHCFGFKQQELMIYLIYLWEYLVVIGLNLRQKANKNQIFRLNWSALFTRLKIRYLENVTQNEIERKIIVVLLLKDQLIPGRFYEKFIVFMEDFMKSLLNSCGLPPIMAWHFVHNGKTEWLYIVGK